MSKLVTGLMFSTLAFAASTFYLSYQLGVEREKNLRPVNAASSSPPRTTATAAAAAGEQAGSSDLADAAEPGSDDPDDPDDRADPAQAAVARDRLARLHDPVTRAEQARQLIVLFREDWRAIAPHVGIAPGQLEAVLADLAERTMEGMEKRFECRLDPTCDAGALEKAPGMSLNDRIAATLGPARFARYQEYQEASDEHGTVFWMNQQLGHANAPSDATAARLVQALADHRRQFIREAEARGEKVEQESSGFISIHSAAVAGSSDENARRKESATAYARRSIEIASGLLNREQLAWFRDSADNHLYNYTERLRRAEIAESARGSGGR